tara:strand:- start:392 stop:589 length:198 start_codon:yes stop_codon:yes gene_type:complete
MSENLLSKFLETHDFSESSRAWRKNKIELEQGTFKYVCGFIKKNNEKCRNPRRKDKLRCHIHKNK